MAKRWSDFFDAAFLAKLERLHLAAKSSSPRPRMGVRRSSRMGDGLEFADHRAYAEGDDVRFVDWSYYARMERLLVRLFHQHSESDVGILLDCSASMAVGAPGPADRPHDMPKFDFARRAAAALAYVALGGHERVVLAPFGRELGRPCRTGRNRTGVFAVLDALAALAPGGPTDLRTCISQFASRHGSVGTVILISDLLDCADDLPSALDGLRAAGMDVNVLHVYSPQEASPQFANAMLLEQAETGHRLAVQATDELLGRYRQGWQGFLGGCRRACLSRDALYVPARTDLALDRMVLRTLRQAGVLEAV